MDLSTPYSYNLYMDQKTATINAIAWYGSQSAAARRLGVTQPTVSDWAARGAIPVRLLLDVERDTGIPRETLRQDIPWRDV